MEKTARVCQNARFRVELLTALSSELDETSLELMNRAIAIFQASNSVDATQTAFAQDRNKGGWQRLVAFFKKSSSNA
ncbi:MAG TPA: hypothetical protein IGS17_16000 [Oscillatoriales cyanobacterium M59_W2019_021]|nr:hypothetical protein [Oscillatoriales cyanobacterium M4454_W2019_049]HIK52410.1 hypothetical protein [Oscillatoriales cyanobacterium M59_W2019_021]